MNHTASTLINGDQSETDAEKFYRNVLIALNNAGVPYLVGGAYAFRCYTSITRQTKDLDLFIRKQDYEQLSAALSAVGYKTELTFSHWLAKVYSNEEFVDLIFNSGNGIAEVDDGWFKYAIDAEVLGIPSKICPVEETIWSKSFIMERERYDGADIVHLVYTCSDNLDWQRLLARFGPHWRVLLIHLIAFGFVYPAQRSAVPTWVMDELMDRLQQETHTLPPKNAICSGPLLSREQYLTDIHNWGYQDARVTPIGNMTPEETKEWTEAIHKQNPYA